MSDLAVYFFNCKLWINVVTIYNMLEIVSNQEADLCQDCVCSGHGAGETVQFIILLLTQLSLGTQTHSLKRACWVSLFVFFAQHICIFFQWLSLACDFTCLFCKVPWVWIGGSLSTPDKHRLRGQSLDRGPLCWRWVSLFIMSLMWQSLIIHHNV